MRPVPAKHPPDEHNEALLRNVHPSGWNNPAPAPCYNLVVIGGGTAGLVTAAGAAGLGAKVALLERELLGVVAWAQSGTPEWGRETFRRVVEAPGAFVRTAGGVPSAAIPGYRWTLTPLGCGRTVSRWAR